MADNIINKDGKLNSNNYRQKVQKQRETFAAIDSTMATLEKLPEFADVGLDFLNGDVSLATNPLEFLFNILKVLGVEEDKLKEWIVEILTDALPAVEIGVKAFLLANIKSIISCDFDPRIPWWLRKKAGDGVYIDLLRGAFAERGVDIALTSIDPEGMLDLSPFTQPGEQYYFGQPQDLNEDSNSKIAKLARADDFNAFLWYVMHKGNRQNPISVAIQEDGIFSYGDRTYTADTTSMKGVVNLKCEPGDEFIAGTTFCDYENPKEVLICIGKEEGKNLLVPLSSDWMSCNWYVDKDQYYNNNIKGRNYEDDENPRDYTKEKPICNLSYVEIQDYKRNRSVTPEGLDNIRFTILPKPAVIIPTVDKVDELDEDGEVINTEAKVSWRIVRLLFDADGTPNSKGKYSLPGEIAPSKRTIPDSDLTEYTFNRTVVVFNRKTGEYSLKEDDEGNVDVSELIECYPGLTVYEFNYDYIMGMKLFDAKTICNRLLQASTNCKYTAYFRLSFNKQKNKSNYAFESAKQRVTEIVRKILESDEEEYNDCFYSFSNEEYDELLRKTAELRYHQSPYTEGYGDGQVIDLSAAERILAEYPQNGTLQEQKEVISRAIEAACASIEDSMPSEYNSKKSSVRINFLTNILQQLTLCLVDSIMSPKILMLLIVNDLLMNESDKSPISANELLAMAKNVVTGLIKELRDLIMQKILDYIKKFLTPMIMELQAFVLSEQFAAYMAIMKLLMSWFNKGIITATRLNAILSSMLSKFKKGNYDEDGEDYEIPTVLDDINYADIYLQDIKDKEPIINNC